MENDYCCELLHIVKRYGGVTALDDVTFRLRKGEIHGLVGENGAGKSTFVCILAGAVIRDEGIIKIGGKEVDINSTTVGRENGVEIIYQHATVVPHLTVAENIFIDNLTLGKKLINWSELNKKASDILNKLGFSMIDPTSYPTQLSAAHVQVVEICKALSKKAKILILDEPTAVLSFGEITKLFELLRKLRDDGVGIIYISHRIDEIFKLCDRITVFKDGRCVKEGIEVGQTNPDTIISLMVGRKIENIFPKRNAVIGETVLKVENLNKGNIVKDVSFEVRSGEVLGFSGLVGSGRTEVMELIFGARKPDSGNIYFDGQSVDFSSPFKAVNGGLGMLPEDRIGLGIVLSKSIRINTTMASLKKFMKFAGIIDFNKEKGAVIPILSKLNTVYADIENPVSTLSGGNQQKVSLSKWLSANCRCIILDEPTHGVDVGAKVEIYKAINTLAEEGIAIILISSEMPEIIGMCDRAIVMREGKINGILEKEEINELNLIKLAMEEV